jgi:MFS family permease
MQWLRNILSQLHRLSAHRSYRRLLLAGCVSATGDRVAYIAFLAAVTAGSTDALAVGGISIAEMLPPLLAMPFVSLVVDRFDRRKLMLLSDLVCAAAFILAFFVSQLWFIFLIAFVSVLFSNLFEPSRQALEPSYIPEGEIMQASSLRQGFMSVIVIVGPGLGGLLVATVGFKGAFLFNAFSFLFSAWMVSGLDAAEPKVAPAHEHWRSELFGGIRIVKANPVLMYVFMLFGAFLIAIGIQFPLIYVFVRESLHGGPAEAGWLFSATGIGGIIGGALLATVKKENNPFDVRTLRGRRNVALLASIDGAVVISFAQFHTLLPVMALFTIFGAIGASLHAALTGAVFALYGALSGSLMVLSVVIGSPFARKYGSVVVLEASASLEFVITIVACLLASRVKPNPISHHNSSLLLS